MAQQFEYRLHIKGPEEEWDFIVPQGESLLGRDPSSNLPLEYPMVSRRHAVLNCTETECTITDLESANGTLVDGTRLDPNEPSPLADQTRITIGPFEIVCTQVPLAVEEEAPAVEEPSPPEAPEEEPGEEPEEEPAEEPEAKEKPAKRPAKAKPAAREPAKKPKAEPPPPPPSEPPPAERVPEPAEAPPWQKPVPGLDIESQRLIAFLPGIYDTNFMRRFLGLFEAILTPIEWNVDHFDLFLDPGTSPMAFLPWLSNWYEIVFDTTWTESQRRTLLKEAHLIYARRGTRWALSRLIEIYTGSMPEIVEFSDPKDPFTFTIKMPLRERDVKRQLLEQLIDSSKPAHASYELEFRS